MPVRHLIGSSDLASEQAIEAGNFSHRPPLIASPTRSPRRLRTAFGAPLAAWRLAELGQLVDLLTAGLRTVLDDLLPVVAPI